MKFDNIKQVSPLTYTFTLSPTHVAYANTLRRLIMTGVEGVAFRADMVKGTTTDVTIRENTTPMTNEMLAHRIGLLTIAGKEPLKWNSEQYTFRLSAKGNKDTPKDIFAGDFIVTEVIPTEDAPVQVPTAKFFPPHPITGDTCLIATLYPGETQKLELVAKASMGTGREHARFQPTSQCTYEYTRDPDPAKLESQFNKWLVDAKKVNPDDISKDPVAKATLDREFNTMEVSRCYLQDERGEPTSFDFTVESVGPLDVPYIVQRACDVGEAMVARYVNIDKADDKALSDEMRIAPSSSRVRGFDFLIRGHDHTLGNLIQTYLVENHIDTVDTTKVKITYAGYTVPHPLRDEVLIRIGVEDGNEFTARKAFAEACRGCVDIFHTMRQTWMQATGKPKTVTLRRKVTSAVPTATTASSQK